MSNLRVATGFILLTCALFGIYTFHAKITCRSSMDRKRCVRQSFLFTVCVLMLAAAVVTLYYIHMNRQQEIEDMMNQLDTQ